MAFPTWLKINPTTGTGNGSVSISAEAHTGRVQRSYTATVKVTGLSDKTLPFTQAAKAEFVTIGNVSAGKAASTVTITGKSNSTKLTFSIGAGDITISLPANYTANGVSTANEATITGDPGAAAEYSFSIAIAVPANTTIVAKTRVITVKTAGGQTANSTITQEKGDPTLSLNPTSVSLENTGAAKSVSVTSNATWTIS